MTNEEQELAAIACGKRSKEDQELWDRVAIACYAQNVQCNRERAGAAICAFDDADAFMAERAKRMKGVA